MSVFDDNITNKTQLESFYRSLKNFISIHFKQIYIMYGPDLHRVSSIFNKYMLGSEICDGFNEYDIYSPWIHFEYIVDEHCINNKILCVVNYLEKSSGLTTWKIFLKMDLEIPSLQQTTTTIDVPTNEYI
jgi:hypothetical protein